MRPILLGIAVAILALIIVGSIVTAMILAFVRRTKGAGRESLKVGIIAGAATAVMVFVLTYCSAWAELRQQVALGRTDHGYPRIELQHVRSGLSDFAKLHGRYPDSLDEVEWLKDHPPRDPWGHPYQYTRTLDGYRLLSLGRDGKPGGVGLDADLDVTDDVPSHIEPTLYQFLFEAEGGATLFWVALFAAICAGLACYTATGRGGSGRFSKVRLIVSALATMVIALLVSLVLIEIYLMGEHH